MPPAPAGGAAEGAAAVAAQMGISLAHRHVFGLQANLQNNVFFADDNQVLYPAGHNTILYSLDTKQQRIFPGHEGTDGITCLALSPSRRHVAICEKAIVGSAVCTIFDVNTGKKRKTLTLPDGDATEFVCVAFSSENKFLITQGGPPDWTLVYWAWDKARNHYTVRTSSSPSATINECSFNPQDSYLICVVGNGVFKFFRLQEGQFKSIPNQLNKLRESQNQNYTCHAWLHDDRLVVCCEDGNILLFDNGGEFKMTLQSSPNESLWCVVPFPKGFICGGDDAWVRVYEKIEDPKEMFRKTKEVKIEQPGGGSQPRVNALAVSISDETLAVTLSNAQLYQMTLSSSGGFGKDQEAPSYEYVSTAFHAGAIYGLDVCVRKPLAVTCGEDKTVRVWNYIDKTSELTKTFTEETFSVAFHPSGFHLIVGFSDKLRLMNLLMEEVKGYKEVPIKSCRECRFSNGGQYFAAVNSNTIQVYKTYTCEVVCNLRGHNGKVRSLAWTSDDSCLASCVQDGAVVEYNIIKEGKREADWADKSTSLTSVVVFSDSGPPGSGAQGASTNTIFVAGTDKMLREIQGGTMVRSKEMTTAVGQLCCCASAKVLFAGIAEEGAPGAIRCIRFPLDQSEYVEYQAHSAKVTRLRLTFDDQFLFTTGEDGCLYIFDVRKKERTGGKRDKDAVLVFADEILVTRSFLDDKQAQVFDLERQVDELTSQIDFQLRHRDSFHKEKMAELEDKYGQEIEQERTKYELLREEKNDMEMEYEENIKTLEENHAKQTAELEQSFQHKMLIEVQRYRKLAQDLARERKEWNEQYQKRIEDHEKVIASMKAQFEQKQRENLEERQRIKAEKELEAKLHNETLRQLEADADREIEELKETNELKLAEEKDDKVRLRGHAGIHRKHHEHLKHQMTKKQEELESERKTNRSKQEKIDQLIKDKESNVKEIRERDKTIGDKEQRIFDLKKQNQELEKFKFVLDYKIKELKAQIDPKDADIAEMKQQIQAMDAELDDYRRKNKELFLQISQLQMKQRALTEEIKNQKSKLKDDLALVRRFKIDLHDCMQFLQEPKPLKEQVASLYRKYVQEGVRQVELDADTQKKYNQQRDYLEKSVESLKRKLAKDSEVHRIDNMRIMSENVSLIGEINDLRREINHLRHEKDVAQHQTEGKGGSDTKDGLEREISMQRDEIAKLQSKLADLDATGELTVQ